MGFLGVHGSMPVAYFDILCKNDLTQAAGFRRPFLACLVDPEGREVFFRAPKTHRYIELPRKIHLRSGGVIDQLMTHVVLGDECVQPTVVYTAGQVGLLFALEWIFAHRATLDVEVSHVRTRVRCLEVEHRDDKGRRWLFEDTGRAIADELLARRLRSMDVAPDLHEDDGRWAPELSSACRRMHAELSARAPRV